MNSFLMIFVLQLMLSTSGLNFIQSNKDIYRFIYISNGSQTIKSQVLSTVKVISANNTRSQTTNDKKKKVLLFLV
jgi:hypothetical protein